MSLDVLGHVGCSRMKRARRSRNSDRRRARERRSLRKLGDVIGGALIAAVALHVRKSLAYTTSSCIEEPPTGRLFF
jgi:hypothetical protein